MDRPVTVIKPAPERAVATIEALVDFHAGGCSPALRALIRENPGAAHALVLRHLGTVPQDPAAWVRRRSVALVDPCAG